MNILRSTLSFLFVTALVITSTPQVFADGGSGYTGSTSGLTGASAVAASAAEASDLQVYRTEFPEGHPCAYAMRGWCMLPNGDGTFSQAGTVRNYRSPRRATPTRYSRANCINLRSPSERRECYRNSNWAYGSVRVINPLFQ